MQLPMAPVVILSRPKHRAYQVKSTPWRNRGRHHGGRSLTWRRRGWGGGVDRWTLAFSCPEADRPVP